MAITAPPAARRLTEDEFLRLPDDGRKYELVDGELKEVPAGYQHDVLVAFLITLLMPFARGRGFLAASSAGFRMTAGNVRSPDVSFARKERLPGGQPTKGFADLAPDLCIEIISPSEERADMERKVREYFASGAFQVWHLFPDARRVIVFRAPEDSATLEADDEITGGDILPGFACRVADLFEIE
jgi:Uma2 family endonuclease